jgi:2-methylcitrate dehydratase PrpD
MTVPAAQVLAEWGLGLTFADVPESARHAARRHLLDGVGLAIVGHRSGAAAPSLQVARALEGRHEARILGDGTFVSVPAAAMADGALVHAIDFDDTHAGGLIHATAVVLPAAFTVGQQAGASGAEVLTAAVIGYETACRVAMASPHGFHARGLHATQVAGVLSSALVASRLSKADASIATHALGIAGSSAGGLLEFLSTGASTKQLHPGGASLNGILAARLAAAGATGPATVLDGPHGIYAALSARPADLSAITEGLGSRWEVERITIKPYPSCQLMHVTLDAVADLGSRMPAADDVVSITAYVHPDSAPTVCEPADVKVTPRSVYDAKFSLPWSLAALIVDGHVGVETYDDASIARPEIAALAAKVITVVEDLSGGGVAADAPGRVELVLTDGSVVTTEVPRSLGGPDHPLSDDQLLDKFFANVGGDVPVARELADRLLALDTEPHVTRIHDLAYALVCA